MTYSTLQLEQIEKMAALYMTITDIATILNVSSEQLRWDISQKDTDVSKAYHKGKVSLKLALRTQETMLAKVGSPLALENCRKNLLDMEDDE